MKENFRASSRGKKVSSESSCFLFYSFMLTNYFLFCLCPYVFYALDTFTIVVIDIHVMVLNSYSWHLL